MSRLTDHGNRLAALTLDFDGNKYNFPAQLDAVLDAICGRGTFRLKDLPGSNLNPQAIVELAGYLQSVGFLTSIG